MESVIIAFLHCYINRKLFVSQKHAFVYPSENQNQIRFLFIISFFYISDFLF